MIADLDKDKSGCVNFDEFLYIMVAQMRAAEKFAEDHNQEQEFLDAFKTLDSDGNGYVDAEELRFKMQNYGSMKLSDEECDEMLREADINGDGKLDFQEFVKMMMAPIDDDEH